MTVGRRLVAGGARGAHCADCSRLPLVRVDISEGVNMRRVFPRVDAVQREVDLHHVAGRRCTCAIRRRHTRRRDAEAQGTGTGTDTDTGNKRSCSAHLRITFECTLDRVRRMQCPSGVVAWCVCDVDRR